MVFGRARRKATEHTINAIRPLIAGYQFAHGLPSDMWKNEFLLGFIGFLIGFHTKISPDYKLSQTVWGFLIADVFTALSNMNGVEIRRNCTRLAFQSPKCEAFERGADYAAICAYFTIGKTTPQGSHWIEKAKKLAAADGSPNDQTKIASYLFVMLFEQTLHEELEGNGA